ncbi:LysR family transcriptional regulator [Roseomonas terrae]|jgi:DNA-binding transcriptional LysR family regulator|uniref:LysR family transcriptional regulator n=1 Tax=Neoroseomonas terrae TaxID=424799 RepID=A0ABS5EIR9_9PROT|nr:LysR family transcriptional regulator [Neoroseomonas terrae]MBR0650931.1 LysR family transcriptional regulator [Neoroseomonas terrae]
MRDLRSLETVIWIARLGGFRAAAARLNTTQSAISARVAQLEQELGIRIFQRGARVTLTAEGTALLRYAEQMVDLREEMLRAIADPAAMRGLLRIGISETLAHTLLPRLVQRIGATHPGIVLDMVVDITPALRQSLAAGQIDIAMLAGTVEDPRAVNQPLCSYPLGWLASPALGLPDRPLRLAELTRWPILSFSHDTEVSAALRALFDQAGAPGVRLWGSTSIATMAELARAGVCVSVMQMVAADRELASGALRRLQVSDVELPDIPFHVAYLRQPDSHVAATIAALAREIAGASD